MRVSSLLVGIIFAAVLMVSMGGSFFETWNGMQRDSLATLTTEQFSALGEQVLFLGSLLLGLLLADILLRLFAGRKRHEGWVAYSGKPPDAGRIAEYSAPAMPGQTPKIFSMNELE